MKRLIAILITLTLSSAALAGEPIFLKKGQTFTATEDSVVFTAQDEQKIRLKLMDVAYMEKVISIQTSTIQSLNTQLDLQQQISDKYRQTWLASDDQLTKVLQRENKFKLFYIALGVVMTVGAGAAMGAAN